MRHSTVLCGVSEDDILVLILRERKIEPVIGRLKFDYRLLKCYLKGSQEIQASRCLPRQPGVSIN